MTVFQLILALHLVRFTLFNSLTMKKFSRLITTGILLQFLLVKCSFGQTANSNIRLWLKADAGTNTTTNGGGITSWTDQGSGGNNPTVMIPSGTITYNNTSTYTGATFFNYNPSITFNGGYLQFPDAFASGMNGSAASLFYAFSILNTTPTSTMSTQQEIHNFSSGSNIVYCPFPYNNGSTTQYADDFGCSATSPITYNFYAKYSAATQYNAVTNMQLPVLYISENAGSGTSWTSRSYLNGTMRYNASGSNTPQYKTNGVWGPVTIFKGDEGTTQALRNSVTEVLLFNTNIPANEKSNINSYLAIKNGVTLFQTTATNYTASASTTIKWANDANVIWTAATNGVYKNNIIGIGKDNLTSPILHQRQSRSVNTTANGNIVAVSTQTLAGTNTTNATNITLGNSYFMVADNGGSIIASSPTNTQVPAGIVNRVTRQWRVEATNFTQDVTIAFDISQLSGAVNPSDLRLLIDAVDNDGNFTNSTIWSGPGGVAPQQNATFPNLYEFRGITSAQLGAANFLFTLGSVAWTTPLPVTLVDFAADCDGEAVALNWITESEHNFDRFVIERSADGYDFFEVESIKGSGNSTTPKYYRMDTESMGIGYFRLKQIDNNGMISFSPVVSANCSDVNGIQFFPNPTASGEEVNWWVDQPFKSDVLIEILDLSGKLYGTQVLEKEVNGGIIPTLGLEKGMYLIRLTNASNKTQIQKLVID